MHKETKERLEELLRGSGAREDLAKCSEHVVSCESCGKEVAEMEAQARMLQLLRSPEDLEPSAGFYARVIERVEARRSATPLYAFVDAAFARRLIFAALTAVIVLGSYLVYSERAPAFSSTGPIAILATQTPEQDVLGANPARDRETLLLTLASYQE